MHLTFYYSM